MTKRFARIGILISIGFYAVTCPGTTSLPATIDDQVQNSAAVFRGSVAKLESYEDPSDGLIYTRAVFQVEEVFKGTLPSSVKLSYRGGTLGSRGEMSSSTLQLHIGEELLMFVSRRADGTLYATRGDAGAMNLPGPGEILLNQLRAQTTGGAIEGSDLNDQAASSQSFTPSASQNAAPLVTPSSGATNLITGSDGLGSRFLAPDRGEGIPYLIDADYLPTGITQTQAVTAVQTALAAWTNVSSVRFKFAGIQSFGKAAPNVTNQDGCLRIQLHDHYNFISSGGTSGDVLGDGGHSWVVQNLAAGWTTGGNVSGNDFHKVVRGYLVLQHTNTFMQNLANFTEVLCHEIGHTIGLGHSSQNPSEPNPILNQAVMYYIAHGDGRGATLNSFDINVIRQLHPIANTPPYCYDRYLDVVTSPTRPLNVSGVNSAQVRGYDLQNASVTFAITGATANNGTFSNVGSNITYVPKSFFADSTRLPPGSGGYYDIVYGRYSDGVNASPFAAISVISFNADSYNEGVPDTWRQTYFGNANPAIGTKHHAGDDADGDGESNLQEYLCGTTPTNKNSNLHIMSFNVNTLLWQAKPYEVYELQASTNFTAWARFMSPQTPTNNTGTVTGCASGSGQQYFRVLRVP